MFTMVPDCFKTGWEMLTSDHYTQGPEDMGSYSYKSFSEFASAIAISRVYGGIHTRHAVEEGTKQGIKTAQNINSKVKFRKE